MADVRRQIAVIKSLPSALDQRSRVRQLKMRYHPDKVAAEQRELFEELSKFLNVASAGIGE